MQVLLVGAGYAHVVDDRFQAPVQPLPVPEHALPFARDLGEHVQPRADVLAALGVVRRGRRQAVRPVRQAAGVPGVEARGSTPTPVGPPAHLVQRRERVVAVEDRVLEALGHHGPGQLLQAQHELAALGALGVGQALGIAQQQQVGDEVEHRRAGGPVAPLGVADRAQHVLAIAGADLGRGQLHVGAIDGEAGDHLGQRQEEAVLGEVARPAVLLRDPVEAAREHVQLARHRGAQDQALRQVEQIVELAAPLAEALVQAFDGARAAARRRTGR